MDAWEGAFSWQGYALEGRPDLLNYVYRGKKTSRFIRTEILGQVRTELANYKKFRRLTDQWIGLALKAAEAKEKLTP